jgi:hypothetical protein
MSGNKHANGDDVQIKSEDYWVKLVEMLQQNWALIEPTLSDGVIVYFIDDLGGVFDEIDFSSEKEASLSLRYNGFQRYAESPKFQSFLRTPSVPFSRSRHPNGSIYSSGRFWADAPNVPKYPGEE